MADSKSKPTDSKFVDLTGKTFGRLKVLRFYEVRCGASRFLCRCECGRKAIVRGNSLNTGNTISCGCYKRELTIQRNRDFITHGLSKTKVYNAWRGMFKRCLNARDHNYFRYGARGITICDRWRSFENFHADMGDPPPNTSLDRINNNGNYEPKNCRWATVRIQANNRRSNRIITHCEKSQTLMAWARELNLPFSTLWNRFDHGWSVQMALTPNRQLPKRK